MAKPLKAGSDPTRAIRSLDYIPDSYGTKLYRSNVKENFRLPMTQAFKEWLRSGHGSRGVRISILTDTFILAITREEKTHEAFFRIWGHPQTADSAMQMLIQWMADVANKEGSRLFSRINAYRWSERVGREYMDELNERLQKYRREPDMDGLYIADVHDVKWGFEKDPRSPNVLGVHLESLDDMRMELHCWIQCINGDTPGTWILRILSDEPGKARIAAKRLQRNVPLNLASIQPDSHQFFLIKPLRASSLKTNVKWRAWWPPNIEHLFKSKGMDLDDADRRTLNYAVFDGESLDSSDLRLALQSTKFISDLHQLPSGSIPLTNGMSAKIANSLYIEHWFSEVMKYHPWYVGYLRMRATIGVCGWGFFGEKPTLSLEAFQHEVATFNRQDGKRHPDPQMTFLSPKFGKGILRRFFESDNLKAANPWTRNTSLTEGIDPHEMPGPSHTAISFDILVHHPSKLDTPSSLSKGGQDGRRLEANPNTRLTRQFTASLDSGDTLWEMLDTDTGDKNYLDINILDLQTPSLSYNLGVHRNSVPWRFSLPEYLRYFGDYVRCMPNAFSSLESLPYGTQTFRFEAKNEDKMAFPDLRTVTQERIWRFVCKSNVGYRVDLVLVETYTAEKLVLKDASGKQAICVGATLKFVGDGLDYDKQGVKASFQEAEKTDGHDGSNRYGGDDEKETQSTLSEHRSNEFNDPRKNSNNIKKDSESLMPASTWLVRVWHQTWEDKFAENLDIKAGKRTDWEPEEWELFPPAFPSNEEQEQNQEAVVRDGLHLDESETSPRGRVYERGSGIREWLRVMQEVEEIISKEVLDAEKEMRNKAEMEKSRKWTNQVGKDLLA
jgi:hypothetical protein